VAAGSAADNVAEFQRVKALKMESWRV